MRGWGWLVLGVYLWAACSEEAAPSGEPAGDAMGAPGEPGGEGTGAAADEGAGMEPSAGGTQEPVAVDAGMPNPAPETPTEQEPDPATLCNGHAALCDRTYDQVAFAATHNAHSSTPLGYTALNANQNRTLPQQLADGVRGLLMDVYEEDGETILCHGPCGLASQPHVEALNELVAFLESNPREVITIIYEDHAPASSIEADFVSTGLVDHVYTHAAGEAWPTLAEMIATDQRLVVTAESAGPPPAWLHHVWDVAFDTPYSFDSADAFSCELNRGHADNDLFLLNHWVGNAFGLPSESGAEEVNLFEVLHGRAVECMEAADHIPNFVAVDFYEHGDLFEVVDALNGV